MRNFYLFQGVGQIYWVYRYDEQRITWPKGTRKGSYVLVWPYWLYIQNILFL